MVAVPVSSNHRDMTCSAAARSKLPRAALGDVAACSEVIGVRTHQPTPDQSPSILQGACGALFSVVPFVSKRALGLVCGFVGAGGNTGSAITQVWTLTESMHQVLHADLPRGLVVGGSPQI